MAERFSVIPHQPYDSSLAQQQQPMQHVLSLQSPDGHGMFVNSGLGLKPALQFHAIIGRLGCFVCQQPTTGKKVAG